MIHLMFVGFGDGLSSVREKGTVSMVKHELWNVQGSCAGFIWIYL